MPTEEEVIVDISPRTPSTESSVETSPGINWPTMRIFTAAVQLVYNPSVESSNQLGTILTIKHLEVQLQDLPTYYGLNQDTNVVGHGSLADGWICVYVPEGTALNKPFPDYATGKEELSRSMNLISLSLDMVPGLKDGRSIRLTTS